ncbi:MAG: Protein translocase subunit SecY [Candidatus Uhrbacteria bacterium GW2011_GWC2_53_7]|uniref:Protein translocase subunit SecY n=1 Tax=Candidatus Uhrbacteria bacterium GW2011_GWC2_53_7 TaxID=1618986 RepID=A0A0G2A878_9BACT|nr:MAG: Protein translocase subunit SecY [Candidatus Uhrbacteria bacterium GW2011_GWC2_53_7]
MSTLLNIFRLKSLRNNILFVLGVLVLFRLVAHLPVPGVDASDLSGVIQGSQFFGLLNIFSGGTLDTFSIVALGVAPYITSSIIFQLLGMISPHLEEMQKEEAGRQKINQWTRLATVPLAVIQAYGLTVLLSQQVPSLADGFVGVNILLIILAMTAGTVFMMWLGELISERHIGNGISILIFAGIIAGLPSFLQQTFLVFDRSDLITLIIFLVMVLATVYAIVVTNEAQRNIPIQHARQIRGARMLGGASSHLPLRLIMAGVIPIIFAISIILLPTTAGQFLINAQTPWIEQAATWMLQVFNNQLVYGVLYFLLVFGFTYFYTAVIFKPENVSENLQKQGAFIPGIRPGHPTAEYLNWVVNRILFAGALFLSLIAVLPLVVQQFTGSANLVIGGTSILIIVAVVIDMIKQIDAQLTMHSYDM